MPTVDVTVYYLEMLSASPQELPALPCELNVLHARNPLVSFYRYLYDAVGKDYNWVNRKKLSDDELAAIINHSQNELHVLYVDGSPAGFAELDRRQPDEIEMVQFGLFPEFIGQGLGKWFLQWTVNQVWSYQPKRFWLHTCTLDHPAALTNYKKAGFVEFKQETKATEK